MNKYEDALVERYRRLDPERRRIDCFEAKLIQRIERPMDYWLSGYPDGPKPMSDYCLWVELAGGYPG